MSDPIGILTDIKGMLNITKEETAFDQQIINHINSAFGTLTQLGVGDPLGFQIMDDTKVWANFYTDPRLNGVRQFVYLWVKNAFDPPSTGFSQDAMDRQIQELGWRLNVVADYG